MSKSNWTFAGILSAAATVGGAVFVWFYFPHWFGFTPRLSASNEPITPQLPDIFDMVRKVRNRVVAFGVHPSLSAALDEWALNGPFPITVGSGVRTNTAQKVLYALGRDNAGNIVDKSKVATYARDATETAHGKRSTGGTAMDLDPSPATVANYRVMGAWFEARGFEWGGRWTEKFPPNGDMRHIQVKGWKQIPVAVLPVA